MSNQTVNDELTAVAGVGSAIARHAASYGIDILPICRPLDIDPADLQSVTAHLPLDRLCRLLETCALLSNDDAFGLKSGPLFVLGSSGAYGYGIMAAPTLRDFIRFLGAHMPYVSQTSSCRLEWADSEASVSWTFSSRIVKRDQYVDLMMALYMRHLRRILGEDADAIAIVLERPRPKDTALFRERLTRQLSFDAPINSIRFPTRLLDQKNPHGDENLFRLMDVQCRALASEEAAGEAFLDQVRRYVRQRIEEPHLALATIAGYFGLSERTFQRRLADVGMTLNDVRDDERRHLALTLLTQSSLSISAIAYRLGYAAPSTFTRSVHRWFGVPPRSLRDRINDGGVVEPQSLHPASGR
jgi:AraC-like DNA-binding protein